MSGNINFIAYLSPNHIEEVIRRAINFRSKLDKDIKNVFNKILDNFLSIKGFRYPHDAPDYVIVPEIKRLAKSPTSKEALFSVIFKVWMISHYELYQLIEKFLKEKGIEIKSGLDKSGNNNSTEKTGFSQIAEQFVREHPEYTLQDVQLMCHCLASDLRIETVEEEITKKKPENMEGKIAVTGVNSKFWLSWLRDLEDLPAHAPEWEEFDAVITAARQIADLKVSERQQLSRIAALEEALEKLKTEAAETIVFFEFSDIATWDAQTIPPETAASLADRVRDLSQKLLRYQDLFRQTPKSVAEAQKQRAALDELEQEIMTLKEALSREFSSTQDLQDKPTQEEPTLPSGAEEEEEEALAEAGLFPEAEDDTTPSAETHPSIPAPQEPEAPAEELLSEEKEPKTHTETEPWEDFFWELILQDDLAGAYWVSRSLEAQKVFPPVPPQVVAAIQGVRWLADDGGELADELTLLASQVEKPGRGDPAILLGLAAALRGCLILPANDMFGWLQVPNCLKHAGEELVTAVQDFVQKGCRLFSMDLLEAGKVEARNKAIQEVSQRIAAWLEQAKVERHKIRRASIVWNHMARNELAALLSPVINNDRSKVEEVRRQLKQWQDRDFIASQIDRIDKDRTGLRKDPIVGEPRKRMIREILDICLEAERWCSLVELDLKVKEQGDWLFNQAVTLRHRIQTALPEVEALLVRLQEPAPLAAAATCLKRSLDQIKVTLKLALGVEADKDHWRWLYQPGQTLETALNRRLVLLPEIPLQPDYLPEPAALPKVPEAMKEATRAENPWIRAFESYLEKEDYRFLEGDILPALEEHPHYAALKARYQEARRSSQLSLGLKIQKATIAIEQALIDGIISDQERAAFDASVSGLRPENELNFRPRQETLDSILQELEKARQERLAYLRKEWQQIKERLHKTSLIPSDDHALISTSVERSISEGDTRVLEEHLAHLTQVLDGSETLDRGWYSPDPPLRRSGIKDFIDSARVIKENLDKGPQTWRDIEACLREGRSWADLRFGQVPRPRREEALAAVKAWQGLKNGYSASPHNREHLLTLLQYLGFSLDTRRQSALVIEEQLAHVLLAKSYVLASNLARPIPQFGSLSGDQYDVICLWERPDVDTVAASLLRKRLGQQPVILLYLGRLTDRQRRQMVRSELSAVAVLDEILLVFPAQELDNRLPTFLRCSLPFASLIPYTPFQAGDVPPEMFYGRREMVQELLKPTGSCLVYGGRQLGKSALLRHVAREFHHPERGQYARVKDIKLVGDALSDQPPRAIWRVLRDALQEMGLLSERHTSEDPKEIEKKLRNLLAEDPNRKIMVLFDEADNFFEADVRDNFREVEKFRILMSESQRRFRVVFAGLNNVLRFQGLPNQPFAHFGTPICVGALEPQAARQLVKEPLETLGYFFEDDSLILKILSYTNYHPGLIQLFCQTLLQDLHRRVGKSLPPYRISRDEVESIYLKDNVRKEIKARLEWTLNLDRRYEAIAWAMIVDQMRKRDNYARTYTPGEILHMVREYWSKGFSQSNSEQIRTFLDEMCGLNVLVRTSSGEYRLRSPNLVRLLGTEDEIEEKLLELMDKLPSEPFDEQGHHAPLDADAKRYSPFLYFQAAQLKQEKFGVGLIFSSEALGLDLIPQAIRRLIPKDFPEDLSDVSEIPAAITTGVKLTSWLQNYLERHNRKERLMVYRLLAGISGEEMESLVEAALSFCHRYYKMRKKWLRIFLIFSPQATWHWLSLEKGKYQTWEDAADAVVITRRWNAVGIRQRLGQTGKQDTQEIVRQVEALTGGWPLLLDELFDRCGQHDNPLPSLQALHQELVDPGTLLHHRFKNSLVVEHHSHLRPLWKLLQQEKGVEWDFVIELLETESYHSRAFWEQTLEFLLRLGCLEERDGTIHLAPLVHQVMGE